MQSSERRREVRGRGRETTTEMGYKGGSMTSSTTTTCNNKKRPCGILLLLLAFVVAVMCVLLLQKLRAGRVTGLILQERDRQLLALQILRQKEKESSEEMKRKIQKANTRVISLRTQKMELTSKLLDTQSMVAYLKEKQREMESTLEKKQDEIKRLAELEADSIKEKEHVAYLIKLLTQREAQVNEMKHHLDSLSSLPDNSAALDSILPMNETTVSKGGEEGKTTTNEQFERVGFSGDNKESTDNADGRVSRDANEIKGNKQGQDSKREQWARLETNGRNDDKEADGQEKGSVQGDAQKKQEVSEDGVQREGGDETGHQNAENIQEQSENLREAKISKASEEAHNKSNNIEEKEQKNPRDGQLEKLEKSQGGVEQESSKVGTNFEMPTNPRIRGRRGHQTKNKNRRRRVPARGRKSEIVNGQNVVKDIKAREDRYALANELSENPQHDGLHRTGEHANNMLEENTMERSSSDGVSEIQMEGLIRRPEGEDGNDGRSELLSNSHNDESQKTEGKEEDSSQDINGDRSPADNRNSLEGNYQESVSSNTKLEVPNNPQDGDQSTTRSMDERPLSTEWQSEPTQKPEDDARSVSWKENLDKSVQEDKEKEGGQPEKEVEESEERENRRRKR